MPPKPHSEQPVPQPPQPEIPTMPDPTLPPPDPEPLPFPVPGPADPGSPRPVMSFAQHGIASGREAFVGPHQ